MVVSHFEEPGKACMLTQSRRLELDGYDPRGLLIPPHPALKSLTVRDVENGDDWLDELLGVSTAEQEGKTPAVSADSENRNRDEQAPRFPSLRHLALNSTSLFSLPDLPCPILTHLDLSNNLLNAIPSSLSSLHTLQTLNLSNNMIESVRGSNLVLGQLHVLNLRNNRIDCLSGLERVLGLERLDLRKNRLYESAEVGRLAVLPLIKEIWVGSGNDFAGREDDWRISVMVTFAEEGKEDVVFDGYPPSWSETRAVQAEVKRRGRRSSRRAGHQHQHRHRAEATAALRSSASAPSTQSHRGNGASLIGRTESVAGLTAERTSTDLPTGSRSTPTTSRAPPTRQVKKRRQRIVDLDGTVRYQLGGSESEDGSTARSSEEANRPSERTTRGSLTDEAGPGAAPVAGTSAPTPVKRSSRQARVAASTHEPSNGATDVTVSYRRTESNDEGTAVERRPSAASGDAGDLSGDALRARMEALKMEVGDSWLKVLAGQAKTQAQAEPEREHGFSRQSNRAAEPDAPVPVVRVVKKVKKQKSKAAVGQIS